MQSLKDLILNKNLAGSQVAVYWLGGTGYIIKDKNLLVGLDLYLTDSCKNDKDDFKRLMPPLLEASDLELDYLIATHDHGDHFDLSTLKDFISHDNRTLLVGPDSVMSAAKNSGISQSRLLKLNRNEHLKLDKLELSGVFADHGEYTPDCIGIIISLSGKNIYFTSDTCYRPDLPQLVNLDRSIDLLIVPINGKYGNPDSKDASYITAWVKPKTVIPSHFWLFKEHGGDPGSFVEHCKVIAANTKIEVPAIGEELII